MAWTTPRTWVAGETPTAAIFNAHVRDNFNALVAEAPGYPRHATGSLADTHAGYADLTGVTLSFPRNGDYLIIVSCTGTSGGGGSIGFQLVVSGSTVITNTTGANAWYGWSRQYLKTGAVAAAVAKLQVNGDGANATNYSGEITLIPLLTI